MKLPVDLREWVPLNEDRLHYLKVHSNYKVGAAAKSFCV